MSSIDKTKQLQRVNIPVGKLKANDLNPNAMSDAEFNMLYDNMELVGFVDPVFVRPLEDGSYRIIGGHHRLEVAKLIGYEEVPCTVIDDPAFDEDQEKFQMVRMNVIKGKMTPQKFLKLYESLSDKYTEQVMADAFGFAEEEEFQKMIASVKKSLPDSMQKEFAKAAKEIKTIDGLSKVLNEMFSKHGDTLPHGYMIVDFGGKDSIWVKLKPQTREHFLQFGDKLVDANRTMEDVLGELFARLAGDQVEELLQELIANSPDAVTDED